MDTPVVGVLLHRDTKVSPEVGVERVLQLPTASVGELPHQKTRDSLR